MAAKVYGLLQAELTIICIYGERIIMKSRHLITLKNLSAALGLFALVQGSAQAVVINTFTSEANWQAAVGSYEREVITIAKPLQPLIGIATTNGSIAAGVFNDVINQEASPSTSFNFNPGVYGIGGTWNLLVEGSGNAIGVNTLSGSYFIDTIANTTNGFWGFTIDETVISVWLNEGSTGFQETYTLDNMHMATSPIPVPAAVWLFGSGLLGLVGIARRKKAA